MADRTILVSINFVSVILISLIFNQCVTSENEIIGVDLRGNSPLSTGENKTLIKEWTSVAEDRAFYDDNMLEDDDDTDDDDESEESVLLANEATPITKTVPNHNDDSSEQIKNILGFGSDISETDLLKLNYITDEDGFDNVKPKVNLPESSETSRLIFDEKITTHGSYDISFGNHVGQIMLCLTMLIALIIVVYIVYLNNPTAVRLVQGKYQEWKYPGKTFVLLDSELGDPLLSRKDNYRP